MCARAQLLLRARSSGSFSPPKFHFSLGVVSWSGFLFYVEVFTFRDLTATFTCQKGEFASFYDNTFMFCVSDAWVKIESLMNVWL